MKQPLFFLFLFLFLLLLDGSVGIEGFTGTYGINYGRIADNIPPPQTVVLMLKSAKIKNVRIYDTDHAVLSAFNGSGLDLLVALPNQYLKDISATPDKATDWIHYNIIPFLPHTRIRGIAVGNEVLGNNNNDFSLSDSLLGAIKNVYNALANLHLSHLIQVYTPHSLAVFANSYPPSSCVFNQATIKYMKPILDFFSHTGAPFFLNTYPFLSYLYDPENIDINYALFQPNSGIHDPKTNLHYDNMFDAQIDAAYAALQAAGFTDMQVLVSETGWASSGDQNEAGASPHNARTYNYNLRKRLSMRKGTPLKPNIVIKAYVFALFNEDLKPGPGSERHYGLFKADGRISYDIGFKGLNHSSISSSLSPLKEGGWSGFYSCASVLLLLIVIF